jgi:beta-glucosidase
MGQNSGYPACGMHKRIEAKNPASKPILFDGAVEGHILVKNVNGALPLKSPRLLSVYGYDAKTPEVVKGDLPNWEIQDQVAFSGTIIGYDASVS